VLISYNLPHVFHSGSDKLLNARTLRIMMDALVAMNKVFLEECMRSDTVPPIPSAYRTPLYQSGVIYDRTTWWEPIPALYQRRYGDCKSLSAAWIAQAQFFRRAACRPVFRFVDNPNGTIDYHILVALANGMFEDPSKVLGMPEVEVARFYSPNSY
jgi:hypothetical protein